MSDIVEKFTDTGLNGYNKIVAGGFFRGYSLGMYDLGLPSNVKSIILIADALEDEPIERQCNNCGKCVSVCPYSVEPYEVEKAIMNSDYTNTVKYGALECTKCGCCSYICPAKRYLTQRIYVAKEIVIDKGLM